MNERTKENKGKKEDDNETQIKEIKKRKRKIKNAR